MSDLSKLFIFVFIFSFFIVGTPLISAKTQVSIDTQRGILVEYPKLFNIKQNQDKTFRIQAYNLSDGLKLDDTTTTCKYFLEDYNNGDEYLSKQMTYDGENFVVNITGGNFSETGKYAHGFYCNASNIGGFSDYNFDVTADGKDYETFPTFFVFLILIPLLIFVSYFNDRLSFIRRIAAIMSMIFGILTLYPGYSYINHSTLIGLVIGSVYIGMGFYYLIEDSFSRNPREDSEYYERDYEDERGDFY